ncbi:MAG: L,D-transpeptidase family protein [Bradyrhizobium sp.]|nr:L,D-transpeptidase family protein [Bradyrhizobium sp.]
MTRVSVLRSSVAAGTLLRIAALAAVGTLAAATQADAALYYYRDSDSAYYSQEQAAPPPRRPQHIKRSSAKDKKKEVAVKDTTVHPQMPLIINVSISQQKVRVYDANGLFAEAPVSTGMAGHGTPMGVFSVIQKDRYHHSNIYSGAPMPYMQRITWGGVALHEGVLPGYPASHGCIRMPGSFAIKMWGWTKLGARVIVSPGELSPQNFAHASLPTTKMPPPAPVAEHPEAPLGAKADKGAPEMGPVPASLELRASVGHSDTLKPVADAPPLRDQTHTADAGGNVRTNAPTMSDASAANGTPTHAPDVKASDAKPETASTDDAKADNAKADHAKADRTKSDSPSSASSETVGKDTTSTDAGATVKPDKPAEAKVEAPKSDAAKTDAATPDPAKADTAKPDTAKSDTAKSDTAKPDTAKADASKPAKAANDAAASAADAKKDQTRIAGDKPVKPDIKRKDGQIAVFISRKDSKLYVRQNFAPLFDVPVTIAASDRPLGTHVFTAIVDKNDPNALHWTVVTVPPTARAAMRDSYEPRHARRKGKGKAPPVAEAKPVPDTPAEALDRITIPPDVMARIMDVLSSGTSIVVSDQGIAQGETGEYTDFIVRTY